jgi:hypothetical protein
MSNLPTVVAMTANKTYKQRKKEKTAKKITVRAAACNCYLKEQGREDEEKQYHDPFCGVWNIGLYKNA